MHQPRSTLTQLRPRRCAMRPPELSMTACRVACIRRCLKTQPSAPSCARTCMPGGAGKCRKPIMALASMYSR